MYALTFYRTVLAIFAAVMGYLALKSGFAFAGKFLGYSQLSASPGILRIEGLGAPCHAVAGENLAGRNGQSCTAGIVSAIVSLGVIIYRNGHVGLVDGSSVLAVIGGIS